jgi:hypothetical protein
MILSKSGAIIPYSSQVEYDQYVRHAPIPGERDSPIRKPMILELRFKEAEPRNWHQPSLFQEGECLDAEKLYQID